MDRFIVKKVRDRVYQIVDTQAKQYNMPEMVGIYFKWENQADTVCNLLNAEWAEFERSPE